MFRKAKKTIEYLLFIIKFPHFRFGKLGKKSIINRARLIMGASQIFIGDGVYIRSGARIEIIESADYTPQLRIGDRVHIENDFQCECASKIIIGNSVLIASRVFITDLDHGYDYLDKHILSQKIISKPVTIGDYTWIGQGAYILKGVSLGKNVIVGAGSVVTKSFPDQAIVAGVPAKLIGWRNKEVYQSLNVGELK